MTSSVAFVVAPYGFGPLSKALAVSSYLPRDIDRVFIGIGASFDEAKRIDEFTACVPLDFTSSPTDVQELLAGFDCLLFINTTRFIRAASAASRPTMLLETLAWLRRSKPDCSHLLTAYFAQKFMDVAFIDALEKMEQFCPVGAIIPRQPLDGLRTRSQNREKRSPILHCGGLYSTEMVPGADNAYVSKALQLARSLDCRISIILPKYLHNKFKKEFSANMELIECSPLTVGDHLDQSTFALSTTGIEFTYECMNLGIPVGFLPPFNASQVHQMSEHQRICPESILFNSCGQPQGDAFELLHASTAAVQREGMRGLWAAQFRELHETVRDLHAYSSGGAFRSIGMSQSAQSKRMRFDGAKVVSDAILSALDLGVGHD